MDLSHGTVVLVADGRKLLFFRNEGDGEFPKLEVERKRVEDNPPDREQGSDSPGRSFASAGTHRSAYDETDFHQLEEDRFAAEAADLLTRRALANDFERLIVVAPPRTLGELRKHYHVEVERRLVGELDKELTGHPVDQIEAIIQAA